VHVLGRGIVIDEPSVVAIRSRNGQREVLAVGQKAKLMVGRTPESIETIRPLRDGVIADFIATEEMLRQFIKRAKSMMGFRRPRILICVPAGATPVERRAVYETAVSAGARRVYLIEEPVAASIGAGIAIDEPAASMVVDIGGGTTDIAVLSLGDVVQARSLRVAGNVMDEAIIRYVRRKHHLVIGAANAERIKIEAGTASLVTNGRAAEIRIRGRDLRQGKPKTALLGPHDIAEALEGPIEEIAEFIQRAIEDLPPEVSSDVCDRGIWLLGGGGQLDKLDVELERRVGVKFVVPDNPMHCVVKGTALVLETLGAREHLLIKP
jgi:rod shape-determining protein MreB